jgi:nucleoside-diphosphate-sugar epimerase
MTILLTGCAGFIGNAVALALLERGDAVIHLAAQYTDTTELEKIIGYKPKVSLEEGVKRFAERYRNFKGEKICQN